MKNGARGQAAAEYLVGLAALVVALCVPVVDGLSAGSLLAARLSQALRGLYALLAQA
ncbi:MAG: hypothetical protein ABW136_03805 [Steroidobacteraceae bacterium]